MRHIADGLILPRDLHYHWFPSPGTVRGRISPSAMWRICAKATLTGEDRQEPRVFLSPVNVAFAQMRHIADGLILPRTVPGLGYPFDKLSQIAVIVVRRVLTRVSRGCCAKSG
jgi:tRNA splicing ligase